MLEQLDRKIKGIQDGKEKVKLSLFADYVILHIENPKLENPKEYTHTPTHTHKTYGTYLLNKLSRVAGYKINTQKSTVFLYTFNE